MTSFPAFSRWGARERASRLGPILLIALGVIFLLETLDIVRLYQIVRYWPVFLIVLGCYMLYARMRGNDDGLSRSAHRIGGGP